MRSRYIPLLRRRREGLTDYRKRKAILLSRRSFVSFFISSENVYAHISEPTANGDKVVAATHSRELMRYGWKGSRKSTPAAYLVGLLLGLKASKKGCREAVPYLGLKMFVKGSRIAALMKGIMDGGVKVQCDAKILPHDKRLSGSFIADFAKSLVEEDKKRYSDRFSGLIRSNFPPERYAEHFREVKEAVAKAFGEGNG